MITKAMYSSTTDEWSTPQNFFDRYNAQYAFETDVCANADNAKCPRYYVHDDGGDV